MSKKIESLCQVLRKAGFKVGVSHYRYATLPATLIVGGITKEVTTQILCLATHKTGDDAPKAADLGVPVISPDLSEPCGGITKVTLVNPEGEEFRDEAMCSMLDNYSKRYGVRVALQRVLGKNGYTVTPRKTADPEVFEYLVTRGEVTITVKG